jgi:acetolactate decarboxylase|tara:strand:- start:609 stop:1274 length:666 start_codon:yes stop_codon:yes gene_type:complete
VSNDKQVEVHHFGALKNMMHKGDLSAKVTLDELKEMNHLFALGAVENLKGEVLILDGIPSVSYVKGNDSSKTMMLDDSFEKNACLLVLASVEEWESINIPNTVVTYEEFEGYVAETAAEKGIDIEKPFPFMIEGLAKSFDWHIIDWPEDDTEHSHEKHIYSGLYGTLENQTVEMLGFYSNKHHAIFTHHSTNMHVHVKSDKATGHADNFTLGENMILKLPK